MINDIRLIGQLTSIYTVVRRRQTPRVYGLISAFGIQYETGDVTRPWVGAIILEPFETEIPLAATVKRLERVEGPVLGGAEFLGEPDAGVLSLCVIDFREQVFVAVRGGSASDHGRGGQQQPK